MRGKGREGRYFVGTWAGFCGKWGCEGACGTESGRDVSVDVSVGFARQRARFGCLWRCGEVCMDEKGRDEAGEGGGEDLEGGLAGLERRYKGVRRVVERHEKSSLAAAWQGSFRLPLSLPENGRF